jgi:HK97 family phage portal protein
VRSLAAAFRRPENAAAVPFASRARNLLSSIGRGDRTALLQTYGSVSTLFAIVSQLATGVAKQEWALYRSAASNRDEDREPAGPHVAADTLNRPNGFYTRFGLMEATQQHIDLVGEGDMLFVRGRASFPLELWPIRPDRIEPVPDREKFLAGFMYRGPDGEQIPLGIDQLKQIKLPNPLDPYRGMGVVQSLLVDLDANRYTSEWNRNFFKNSATPGGVIELPHKLGDTDFRIMRERWSEQHAGVGNAHRVAILENAKWVDSKYTMRDMQFTDLRKVSDDIIRQAFAFPKPMLGVVDDVNRAVAEAMITIFASQLLVPRLDRWKEFLNTHFLPAFGDTARGLEFDYVSPVPADREADDRERESKANAAKVLIEAGYDAEDVGQWCGLPPMRWTAPPKPTTRPVPAAGAGAQVTGPAPLAFARPVVELSAAAQRVQSDWTSALDNLIARWPRVAAGQRESLTAQVRAAIEADEPLQLTPTALAVDTGEAADVLAAAMTELASTAATRVVQEAAAQDVTAPRVAPDSTNLVLVAAAVAAFLGADLLLAAGREALRLWIPGRASRASRVASSVDDLLAARSLNTVRAVLGGALTRAQNTGRIAAFSAAQAATYYASEVLDRNTCKPCDNISGKRLPTVDAMLLAYGGNGGYLLCEGRERCRGYPIAVWEG